MASFALFRILCVLVGKACVFLAVIFLDEVEALCAEALQAQHAAGLAFWDRCRSGLRQARSRLLWGDRGLVVRA
jgi:hypothetical protein